MSPSLRFLAVALVAWGGVRAATLGVIPAGDLLSVPRSEAKVPPPLIPTELRRSNHSPKRRPTSRRKN
jgi:hypothetical protein